MEEAEEWISDIEYQIMENNEAKKKRERQILFENSRLRGLRDISYGSQKRKRGKRGKGLFEQIIAENCPNLGKETDIQI